MVRLLRVAEAAVAIVGGGGCIALSAFLALTETTRNRSVEALAITGLLALFALLLAVAASLHSQRLGQLRWLGLILVSSLVLWITPGLTFNAVYNESAAIAVYGYAGILGSMSGVIGIVRELISHTPVAA